MNGSSLAQAKIEGAYTSGIINAPASSSVDHNTGILNYSIPLVSISHNDVKVNIALSYAARGIKVEQKPTSVGLGWNLSGIGVISRTVRGSETDESWSRGKLDDTTSEEGRLSPEHFDRINGRVRDGESDIFALSYNHLSIRFILKRVNDSVIAVPLERTNVKIIVVEGMALSAFKVIDEGGNQYYFGDKEAIGAYHRDEVVSKNNTSLYGSASAWFLSHIKMFNGEEVDFEYTTDYVSESNSGSNEMVRNFGRPYRELRSDNAIKTQIDQRITQLGLLGEDAAGYRASISSLYKQLDFKYWEYQDRRGKTYQEMEEGDIANRPGMELFFFSNQITEVQYRNQVKSIMDDITNKNHLLDWNQGQQSILDYELNALIKDYYKYIPVNWQYTNLPTLSFFRPKLIKRIALKNKEILFNYTMGTYHNHKHLYLKSIVETDLFQNQYRLVNLKIDDKYDGFLHELIFTNSTFSDSVKYKFGYELTEGVSWGRQDYWGFYNGKTASSLIPKDVFYTVKQPGGSDQLVFVSGFPSLTQDPNVPDSMGGTKTDRTPDVQFAKQRILKEVELPEGGTLLFDYELNTIYSGPDQAGTAGSIRINIPMGGLRIKSIRSADGMGNTSETEYLYEFFTQDSLFKRSTGKLAVAGMQAFAFRVNYPGFTDHFVSSSMFDFSPYFSSIGNENIVYHYVEETKKGIGTVGYKFFNFTEPLFRGARGDGPSAVANTQFHWLEGLLLAKAQYDTLNKLVQLDKFKYLLSENDVPGNLLSDKPLDYSIFFPDCFYNSDSFAFADKHIQIKANPGYYDSLSYAQQFYDADIRLATLGSNATTFNMRTDYFVPNIEPRLKRDIPVMLYSIMAGGKVLTKKVSSYIFDPNAAVVTTSSFPRKDRPYYFEWLLKGGLKINQQEEAEYFYDNPQHTYISRVEEKGDNGDIHSTRNKFVSDYADAAHPSIPKLKAANVKGSLLESQKWLFDAAQSKWFLLSGELSEYKEIISDSGTLMLPVFRYNTSLPQKLEPGTGAWTESYTAKPPFNTLFHENSAYYKLLEQNLYAASNGVIEQSGLKKTQDIIAEAITYDPFTGRQNALVFNAKPEEVFSLDFYWLHGPESRNNAFKFFRSVIDPAVPNFADPATLLEKDCKEFLLGMYKKMQQMGLRDSVPVMLNDSLFKSMYYWYASVGEGWSSYLQDSLFTIFRNLAQSRSLKPATITACAPYFNASHAFTFADAFSNWPPPRENLFKGVFGTTRSTRFNGMNYELDFDITAYRNSGKKMKIYGTNITSIPIKIYYSNLSPYQTSIIVTGTAKYGISSMLFDPASLPNWQYVTRISFLLNNSRAFESLLIVPERATFKCNVYSADETVKFMYDHNLEKVNFSYDWQGRVSLIRDKNNFITKRFCYNYARQPVNCRVFYNVEKSQVFSRNNCPAGLVGKEYLMVIPAGKYAGSTQHLADSLALRDIAANGQSYANLYAGCDTVLYKNVAISGNYNNQNCYLPEVAVPLLVTIPANTYTSTISQAHANSLAQQAAQNYANTHGTCEFPVFNMNIINSTSSVITVTLTNTATSATYGLTVNPGAGVGSVPPGIINMQAGFYTVEATVHNSGLSYRINMSCQIYGPYTGSYSLMNVTLSTTCNSIRFY